MPLQGLKVIELAGLAPGPLCGKFLCDFGASVILVTKFPNRITAGVSEVDRGKKSIALNMKTEKGSKIFRKLVSSADILLEPFRKGVMEKLGFGPNVLLLENPKLIYARLSGYGQNGYYSSMAGHDINYLSITGLLSMYGWRGKYPVPPSNFSEFAGGSLMCFTGIVLALLDRVKTGKGQVIDCSIVEGMSYVGSWLMLSQNILFSSPRGQNFLDGGAHFYDTYETKDGRFVAVGAIEPQFYSELLRKLNLNEDEVPQFENTERNREIFQQKFKEKTLKEWTEIFDLSDACVTPVLTSSEAPKHKHNVDRKAFIKNDDETVTPARAPRLSEHPENTSKSPPPSDGQDTCEILINMGYSLEEIKTLCAEGIVLANIKNKL